MTQYNRGSALVGVVPVDENSVPIAFGDASAANQDEQTALLTAIDGRVDGLETLTGAVTETAPASDTASSGLNGRLQRLAQRITSLITALGSPLQAMADYVAGTTIHPYGNPKEIAGTLTPQATAYALAQSLGGLITVDIGAALGVSMANKWIRIYLVDIVLRADAAPTNQTIAPVLFNANPSASTFTDQTTSVLAAADVSKVVNWFSISASGGSNVVGNAINWLTQWTTHNGLMIKCDANGCIYMALMLGGACTPGAGAAVSWRVQFGADI